MRGVPPRDPEAGPIELTRSPLTPTTDRARVVEGGSQAARSRARTARITVAAVLLAAAAGIAIRIWLLNGPAGVLDSDEAIPGLMARHLLQGDFSTFYWGQNYGGTLEVFVDALAIAIGGTTRLALKAPPLLEAALASVLVWRLGRRTVGPGPGVVAGIMTWIWPAGYVWYSTLERVFYLPLLLFGLTLLLVVLRLAEDPRRWTDWILAGILVGAGWWTGPQIAFYALPGAVWLLVRLTVRVWPGVVLAAAAAFAAAMPWIVHNARSGFASFDTASISDHQGYVTHLQAIFERGLPVSLGLRFSYSETWLLPPLGVVLAFLALAAVLVAAVRLWRTSSLLVLVTLAFPLLAALSPSGGFAGEGRYMIYVWPLVSLLLAGLAANWAGRKVAIPMLVGTVALVSVIGLNRIEQDVAKPIPRDTKPLVHGLERLGVRDAFADYWLAYRVTYESGERLIATPSYTVRNLRYLDRVRSSRRVAYLFATDWPDRARFEQGLDRLGIPHRSYRFGGYTAILPARRTSPEAVAQAAGSGIPIP